MNTRRSLKAAAWVTLTLSFSTALAGCQETAHRAQSRSLPLAADVVPSAIPVPVARKGQNARVYAAEVRAAAAENATRLGQGRANYERVRAQYGVGE